MIEALRCFSLLHGDIHRSANDTGVAKGLARLLVLDEAHFTEV